ncbi:MAG: hypothetical protein ACRECX_03130 [Methyloceanibacter sp.]|uniref:hypothetical protein n=1 Tax=Methyloceanibacter sp. TaxID=1965321 RepID=UPI003D6D87F2
MPRAEPHAAELASDQAVENAALAGAAAIQRIVAERNALRSRLGAQHREIVALRSINEDLRRRLILIHQHYVELAKQVVGHLEHFDGTVREVVQEAHNGAAHRGDAAPPASLVQRLAEADHADENPERPDPAPSS